jgi:hypothetical protein
MSGNDPLKELLETMPRERAREGFTSRVLAELDRRPAPSRWSGARWLVPAAAAVGLVLVLAVAGSIHLARERDRRAELAAQLDTLRQEHRLLTEDLKDLRRRLFARPVIYLGGDDRADYVLDLHRVVNGPAPGTSDLMPQPVIHGPDDLIRGESL